MRLTEEFSLDLLRHFMPSAKAGMVIALQTVLLRLSRRGRKIPFPRQEQR